MRELRARAAAQHVPRRGADPLRALFAIFPWNAHGVFSLCYHAFVFLVFSLLFLTERSEAFLPRGVRLPIALVLLGWLLAYLPIILGAALLQF